MKKINRKLDKTVDKIFWIVFSVLPPFIITTGMARAETPVTRVAIECVKAGDVLCGQGFGITYPKYGYWAATFIEKTYAGKSSFNVKVRYFDGDVDTISIREQHVVDLMVKTSSSYTGLTAYMMESGGRKIKDLTPRQITNGYYCGGFSVMELKGPDGEKFFYSKDGLLFEAKSTANGIKMGDVVYFKNDRTAEVKRVFDRDRILVSWLSESGTRDDATVWSAEEFSAPVQRSDNGIGLGYTVFGNTGAVSYVGEVTRIFANGVVETQLIQINGKFIEQKETIYEKADALEFSPYGFFWRKLDEVDKSYKEISNVVYLYKRSFLLGMSEIAAGASLWGKLFTLNAIEPLIISTDSAVFRKEIIPFFLELRDQANAEANFGSGVRSIADFAMNEEIKRLSLQMLHMGLAACKEFLLSDADRKAYESIQLALGKILAGNGSITELLSVLKTNKAVVESLKNGDRTAGLGLMLESLIEYLEANIR